MRKTKIYGVALTAAQSQFIHEFRQRVNSDVTHGSVEHYFGEGSVLATARGEEPLPSWLKLQVPKGAPALGKYHEIRRQMRTMKLSTVCEEAKCPNIGECWGGGEGHAATATIMIMGSHCTRACRFCSVLTSKTPPPLDPAEPTSVGEAVAAMGVDYIVVTMVDRDDLPDGGSAHIADTVRAIKKRSPKMLLEVLAGDFAGQHDRIDTVATSGLDVYAHNVECVERITPNVRDRRATYRQSLAALERAATKQHPTTGEPIFTKSSIMLGLGEHPEEVRQCLKDLRCVGVSAVTLGQYLQPSRSRMRAVRYAHPKEFDAWKEEAMGMGFVYCASGPMVRSSYRAGEYFIRNYLMKRAKKEEA